MKKIGNVTDKILITNINELISETCLKFINGKINKKNSDLILEELKECIKILEEIGKE